MLPSALIAFRGILGPVVLLCAMCYPEKPIFVGCLVAALLSDFFDGVIARRLGIATAVLRRMDSLADTGFYVCSTTAAFLLYPEILGGYVWPLAALAVIEGARYVFDFWKFGREASYHMWSSKAWGLLLFATFVSLLGFGVGGPLIPLAIYWGIVADIEGLAISIRLRVWRPDVPTFWHARRVAAGTET